LAFSFLATGRIFSQQSKSVTTSFTETEELLTENQITLTPGQITGLIMIVQNLVDGIEAQQTELRVRKMPF